MHAGGAEVGRLSPRGSVFQVELDIVISRRAIHILRAFGICNYKTGLKKSRTRHQAFADVFSHCFFPPNLQVYSTLTYDVTMELFFMVQNVPVAIILLALGAVSG